MADGCASSLVCARVVSLATVQVHSDRMRSTNSVACHGLQKRTRHAVSDQNCLPSSSFFAALMAASTPPSIIPATVNTPPMMAHTWKRQCLSFLSGALPLSNNH
eukprot:scaffold84_cov388-Prasinococcus_capsulatus_cf.AAC.10